MKVIGVSGMPGSGKSLISNMARKRGFFIIRMGDMIRKEAEKRNEPTGKVAIDLRNEMGDFVVAELCVNKINEIDNKNLNFLIEGIRSPFEVELFRKKFKNFKLVSVHSSPKNRFNRIRKRQRNDDSNDYSKFKQRDQRELNFGIGTVIVLSDYMILNDGPIKKYKTQINIFLNNETQKVQKFRNKKRHGR